MNLTKTMKKTIGDRLVEKRFPFAEYEKPKDALRQELEADGPAKWKEAQMLASRYTKYIDKQCRIYIEGISLAYGKLTKIHLKARRLYARKTFSDNQN